MKEKSKTLLYGTLSVLCLCSAAIAISFAFNNVAKDIPLRYLVEAVGIAAVCVMAAVSSLRAFVKASMRENVREVFNEYTEREKRKLRAIMKKYGMKDEARPKKEGQGKKAQKEKKKA